MQNPTTTPLNVLLVDDNARDALLTQYALTDIQIPHNLKITNSVQDGLSIVFDTKKQRPHFSPDLILLDLWMPVRKGTEMLKAIKAHKTAKHIPTVIISTSNAPNDREICRKLNADGYIVKDVDFLTFIENMQSLWMILGEKLPTP